MRLILLFVCTLLASVSFAQSDDLIALRGNVSLVSFYQGGAPMPDEYRLPQPYSTRLWVVEYIDSVTVPTVITQVETDSLGNFTVYLPPGQYGFLTAEDVAHPNPGQVLPTSFEKIEDYNATSQYWVCSEQLPLALTEEKTISLTYYDVTSCMMCP